MKSIEEAKKLLAQLERGEITFEEARKRLSEPDAPAGVSRGRISLPLEPRLLFDALLVPTLFGAAPTKTGPTTVSTPATVTTVNGSRTNVITAVVPSSRVTGATTVPVEPNATVQVGATVHETLTDRPSITLPTTLPPPATPPITAPYTEGSTVIYTQAQSQSQSQTNMTVTDGFDQQTVSVTRGQTLATTITVTSPTTVATTLAMGPGGGSGGGGLLVSGPTVLTVNTPGGPVAVNIGPIGVIDTGL